jgi:hypothetical protein
MLQEEANADELPWWTEEEEEHAIKRLHCLKNSSYDPETNQYRDIRLCNTSITKRHVHQPLISSVETFLT